MKQRNRIYFFLLFFIILFIVCSSCNLNNSRAEDVVIASIVARGLPSTITSINLTVSGEGMETIVESIDPSEASYTIEIPAGTGRLFELEMAPSSENVFLKYTGSTTSDLIAGETADIDISMEVSEMRLVIPDYANTTTGPRIIQIDDITGANWQELKGTDINFASDSEFLPYDIDYDSNGRIYIANNYSSTGSTRLVRLDSFQDTAYEEIVSELDTGGSGVSCVAVDRVNNYVYYSSAFSPIRRKNLGPPLGTQETFDILAESAVSNFSTSGYSVDEDGILYITNNMENSVIKYDPSLAEGSRVIDTYSSIELLNPWDTMIFGDYIIVSNESGATGYRIFVLDKNMNLVNSFGTSPSGFDPITPTDNDYFGPKRFIAILNKKITVIDEGQPDLESHDYLVQIDDIYGNGWTQYGSTGTGIGQFWLYSMH